MSEPTAGWRRAARVARMGMSAAAGLATGKGAASVTAQLAESLAELRGLAAKAGQMGAYLDAVVGTDLPPAVREALQRLNDATTHSDIDAIRAVIREDLPDQADAILSSLDPVAVGSGSVAQVHRATLPDGRAVAVKVQHPGVARVILGELGNAGAVVGLVGAIMPGVSGVYEEVRGRLVDELDQLQEATWTERYAQAMRPVPGALVPEVVRAWTSARVLTTTWEDGIGLDEAARSLSQEARDAAATVLLRTFAAGVAAGLVHGDPNAGNYRFRPDGSVVLLDLGCVQEVPQAARGPLLRALAEADATGFGQLFGPDQGPAGEATRALAAKLLVPLTARGPILRSDLHAIAHAIQAYKASLARHRASAGPPWSPLVLRTWTGLVAHVHHLGASVDGAALRRWIGEL